MMRPPSSSRFRCGLTLIELLAIVVILALVGSMGVMGLSSLDASAALERFGSEWRAMDARARLLAQRKDSGAVALSVVGEDRITLTVAAAPDLNATITRPARNISMLVFINGESDWSNIIRFDVRGCSPDYLVEVFSGDRVARRWFFAGETGWVVTMDEVREGGSFP